jgi:hypothetical protein
MQSNLGVKTMRDKFFMAASRAAIEILDETGGIPVALSALVKKGRTYDLIPIGNASRARDVRMLDDDVLDKSIKSVVSHVNSHKGAQPIVFFLSMVASGQTKDLDTGETEEVDCVISAARTSDRLGRTSVYKIKNKKYFDITQPENEKWSKFREEDDIPCVLAQGILDKVWKSYIINYNMNLLKI